MSKYFHSVQLDADRCCGCTNCLKRCPTEAIRVHDGKAKILSEILSTTIEDIKEAIDIFRFVNEQDRICVIGNRAALEKCEDLSVIFDLNKTH